MEGNRSTTVPHCWSVQELQTTGSFPLSISLSIGFTDEVLDGLCSMFGFRLSRGTCIGAGR